MNGRTPGAFHRALFPGVEFPFITKDSEAFKLVDIDHWNGALHRSPTEPMIDPHTIVCTVSLSP